MILMEINILMQLEQLNKTINEIAENVIVPNENDEGGTQS